MSPGRTWQGCQGRRSEPGTGRRGAAAGVSFTGRGSWPRPGFAFHLGICEKMSRKKQKALVVAHPAPLGQGSSPCGVLASFQLPPRPFLPTPSGTSFSPRTDVGVGCLSPRSPPVPLSLTSRRSPPRGEGDGTGLTPRGQGGQFRLLGSYSHTRWPDVSLFSPGVGMGGPCGQGGRCCASESTPQSRVGRKALGSVCRECRLVGYKAGKRVGL